MLKTKGVGFFGKLPALGDFVSRRLSPQFVKCWDDWLHESLLASRGQLGDTWLDSFLISPVWRFFLGPGICGDQAWVGIMMPSVDRVGRYFPLTLAQNVDPVQLPAIYCEQERFDALESLALSVLTPDFAFDQFDLALAAATLTPAAEMPSAPSLIDEDKLGYKLDGLHQLPLLNALLLQRLLGEAGVKSFSLWLAKNTHEGKSQFYCFDGLPKPDEFSFLLLGRRAEAPAAVNKPVEAPGFFNPAQDAKPGDFLESGNASTVFPFVSAIDPPPAETFFPDLELNHKRVAGYGKTVVGNVRKHNEDSMLLLPECGVWLVADGMGGGMAGDYASQSVVEAVASVAKQDTVDLQIEAVAARLQKVNADLFDYAAKLSAGGVVGSTVVILLIKGEECGAIWAGDSRLYRYRQGQLTQLTRDHSAIRDYMDLHNISFDQAATVVNANVITRAIGADRKVDLDTMRFTAQAGDRFLLCSDGLDKELRDEEIEQLMRQGDCQATVENLIAQALQNKGRDNITAIVVDFNEA